MGERIHADEADTSREVVDALLRATCPAWAPHVSGALRTSGTDNAMWRVDPPGGRALVVRLPRTPGAAVSLAKEMTVLPAVAGRLPVTVPTIAYAGSPGRAFPHPWMVLEWVDGADAWEARRTVDDPHGEELAHDLAEVVCAVAAITDVDVPQRVPSTRGGPLGPLLDDLEEWLVLAERECPGLVDTGAVRRSAHESAEVADAVTVPDRFVHSDLIPGNILLDRGRLSAVIDWGGSGIGDAALDLTPAWAVLDRRARQVFREATGADDAAWLRARAFALQQAVGGVVYYTRRAHVLGDVMRRTLDRILHEG